MTFKKTLYITGSEWFAIALGTLAVSVLLNRMADFFHSNALYNTGIFFLFLGMVLFLILFALWTARTFVFPNVILEDWNNLNRISFSTVVPLSMMIMNVSYISYYPSKIISLRYLSYYNYIFDFIAILLLSFYLGYKMYTKNIEKGELTYAELIPPVALSSTVFLGKRIIPLGGINADLVYFMILMGFGIALFLFLFIGIMAFTSHIRDIKSSESSPVLVLPVGVSSILVINIITLSQLPGIFNIPLTVALFASVSLWSFELWNFIVAMLVSIKKVFHAKPGISIWAYTFPLAVFSISSLKLSFIFKSNNYIYPYNITFYTGIIAMVILIIAWTYAVVITLIFIKRFNIQSQKSSS
ncbi:SLAC1 family transporter [Acidiplasma cupricumulans]|uniref:C4-dicarboxylate ABC transporter n=1 Tax=Acidiplasma cupricumulans TaxID=312540 RepID=A0A0N8VLF8_9ARCH|nr:hypothetical protein [Acidiplasma cupricumulans]KQB36404.1 hypothetical protein AOG55_04245 [Acidiplasma cupricumulans]